MKRISIISLLFIGSLLITLLYSCIKEGLSDPTQTGKMSSLKNANAAFLDSGCNICSENKQVVLIPANFFAITGPGVEMSFKYGRATISDPEIQQYKKINVTVIDQQGWETAVPFFNMAADGSYESVTYKRASSVLTIAYVRFNKATNTFTFKPVNDLTVKYGLSHIN